MTQLKQLVPISECPDVQAKASKVNLSIHMSSLNVTQIDTWLYICVTQE